MTLRVLSIGYPLAKAGLNAVGGSEQILAQIDRGLVTAGMVSHVIAPAGSEVAGTLHPIPSVEGPISEAVRLSRQEFCRQQIRAVLARHPIDVVHFHGLDFSAYPLPSSLPAIASLHLPPDWYAPEIFAAHDGPWLLPVSETQAAQCPPSRRLLKPLANGVPDELFEIRLDAHDGPPLMLTRICPEKGVHLALEAAHHADKSLVIAGQIYPYPEHIAYFAEKVAPLLDERRRFIGPVGLNDKIQLLKNAACVLVPSLVAETSSLVVREAGAMGCPVIAFRQGHLAQSVVDGVTGFLVDDMASMQSALSRIGEIDPVRCRAHARKHFSGRAMVDAYLALYARMVTFNSRAAAQ